MKENYEIDSIEAKNTSKTIWKKANYGFIVQFGSQKNWTDQFSNKRNVQISVKQTKVNSDKHKKCPNNSKLYCISNSEIK